MTVEGRRADLPWAGVDRQVVTQSRTWPAAKRQNIGGTYLRESWSRSAPIVRYARCIVFELAAVVIPRDSAPNRTARAESAVAPGTGIGSNTPWQTDR